MRIQKKIVGYNLHKTLAAESCMIALQMALQQRTNSRPLIHHSDRGCQYCCKEYVDLLRSNNIAISMTNKGDPYENAIAERVNGILKSECNLYSSPLNYEQICQGVIKAIDNYNGIRPHASCDYLTPNQAHAGEGQLKNDGRIIIKNNHYPKPLKTTYF